MLPKSENKTMNHATNQKTARFGFRDLPQETFIEDRSTKYPPPLPF